MLRQAMHRSSRIFLGVLFLAIAQCALAQAYPAKPLRLVAPFPPGGAIVATIPHVLVIDAARPASSVQEPVQLVKSGRPLNYGSAGNGSPQS
jgi:tripartite-type tricarboxylate transporter receptor subunit TctC